MKQLHFTFLLAILMSMVGAKALAYDAKVDGIYYSFSGTTATVTYISYSSSNNSSAYSGNVVIPESVTYNGTTYSVTRIGSSAFYSCTGLTSVTIPNSVTSIGDGAFIRCSSLTSITIPNSVTSIGDYVFDGCSGLTSIVVEAGNPTYDSRSNCNAIIETASNTLLYGCMNTSIPNSVTSIGDNVFDGCTGLTSITIPNSVTSIGGSAFNNCSGLKNIIIEDSDISLTINSNIFSSCPIESVYYGRNFSWSSISREYLPFYNKTNLISLTIGNNVTYIANNLFYGCSGLTSVAIPDNVTGIGNYAFYGCSGLTSVIIPDNVTSIGSYAFAGCSGLQSVLVGNGITSLPERVFGTGNSLKTLTIGSGVLSIHSDAFYNGSSRYRPIKTIWLTNTPPTNYSYAEGTVNYVANDLYTSLSNKTVYPFLSSLFEVDGVKYVPVSPSERTCDAIDCLYSEGAENIHIGKTVTNQGITLTVKQVHPYAFYQNTYIKDVDLSFSGNVGNNAFYQCTALSNVKLSNAGNINQQAFYGCTGLKTATINNKGRLGNDVFRNCSGLETATLGEEIPSIGTYAFSGCSSLKEITIPNAVKTLGQYAFQDCSKMTTVKMGTGIKSIETYTFSNCSALTDMQIGSNVTTINTYAFSGCTKLPVINIPRSVTDIKNYVFYKCSGLKTVIMEDRETVLNLGAGSYYNYNTLFSDCPLDSVYIGGNINYNTGSGSGYSPFYRNTSLRAVMITDKETEISENEFYGCTNLKNVYIGDGVESIGNWAFSGCSSLDYFAFGTAVKTIGKEAFSDCTAITHIISHAATPPACGTEALDDINKWTCTLQVPLGGVDSYKAADQWKEFFYIQEEDGSDLWFKLTYMVDGEEYKTYNLQYGAAITPEAEPTKEGYTFSGWSVIPETMPARDVTISGTFTKNEDEPENPDANKLTLAALKSNKGQQIQLPIAMENDKAITGLQIDLYLPAGVTVATNSRGKMIIETTERMDGDYTISSNQRDSFIRILGYSADGYAFSGSDGNILNVTLNISENMADGDYTIRLKDIVLSDVSNKEYHPADVETTLKIESYTMGDVDGSGAININDVVCIINYILGKTVNNFIAEAADVDGSGSININDVVTIINRYILMKTSAPAMFAESASRRAASVDENYLHLDDITIDPGETKVVKMLMTNTGLVAAIQGKLMLPAGLSIVKKSNGRVDAQNINARSEDFTLSTNVLDDGSLTFAQYSADGFTYEGNEGGIFTFKIKADENATAGTYSLTLSNVVLSIDGVGYDIPERMSSLTVTGTSGISNVNVNDNENDNYYSLDGRKLQGKPTQKGVYIQNGHKVVIK